MILDRITRGLRNARGPRNATLQENAGWLANWVRGIDGDGEISVNGHNALKYAPVWQAVNIIAGDVGQLPLCVFANTHKGRERATMHPAYRLLRRRPNRLMNAGTFRETLQAHALLWGNGRAGIVRDADGNPTQLVPFLPDRSYEQVIDGELYHLTRLANEPKHRPFHDQHVLHIKGLGFDGTTGYSVVEFASRSLKLGLAHEKHAEKLYDNSARPSVVLESDATFSPEDAKTILADWDHMNAGLNNTGRTALLHRGLKINKLSMSLADAQWLEGRKFQRAEVAAWFNLPPHKLGDDARSSYNSLEQENQSYLNSSLMRWLVCWSEEGTEKLLTEREKAAETHYVEFITAALLRGDLLTRYRAYQIGISSTFMAPDEARRAENMNDRPDGQGGTFTNPNTTPAGGGSPANASAALSREMLVGRLEELAHVEANRVAQAAARPKAFCAWLDTFYSHWRETLARVVVAAGGTEALAAAYAETSRQLLLAAAGRSTAETLRDHVHQTTAGWTHRCYDLATQIQESH